MENANRIDLDTTTWIDANATWASLRAANHAVALAREATGEVRFASGPTLDFDADAELGGEA